MRWWFEVATSDPYDNAGEVQKAAAAQMKLADKLRKARQAGDPTLFMEMVGIEASSSSVGALGTP